MSCDKIKTMLNDYLDGDLPGDMKRFVDTHLDQCAHCRGEFEGLKEADDLLSFEVKQMFSEIPVPGSLLDGIERKLAREKTNSSFFQRVLPYTRYAGGAAALFVLIAAAGLFWSHFVPLGDMGRNGSVSAPQVAETNAPTGDWGPARLLKDQESTGPAPGTGDAHPKPGDGGTSPSEDQSAQTPPTVSNLIIQDSRDGAGNGSEEKVVPEGIPQKPEEVPQKLAAKDQPAQGTVAAGPPAGAGAGIAAAPRAMSGGAPKDLTEMRASGASPLKRGSMDQAVRETGFTPKLPSYMPESTSLVDVAWQDGAIYVHYRVSGLEVTLGQRRVPSVPAGAAMTEGLTVDINGVRGVLVEAPPGEGGANSRGVKVVYWENGGWAFSVQGGLPPAELLKIASSIQ